MAVSPLIKRGYGPVGWGGGHNFILTRGLVFTQAVVAFGVSYPQWIGQVTIYDPAVTGFRIYINGTDRSNVVLCQTSNNQGLNVQRQINSKDTATFIVRDPNGIYIPSQGDSVVIYQSGTIVWFRGEINQTTVTTPPTTKHGTTMVETACTCVGSGIIADRRSVGTIFPQALYPTIGSVAAAIINTSLAGTGIVYVHTSAADAAVTSDLSFNFNTVTEALNMLGQLGNCDWRIDELNNFRFFTMTSGYTAAPENFTDTSVNWLDMQVITSRARYANRVVAVSTSGLRAFWVDTQTRFTDGGAATILTRFPLMDVPKVFINSMAVTVAESSSPGAGGAYFSYTTGQFGVTKSPLTSPLAYSDVVTVVYLSTFGSAAIAQISDDDLATQQLQESIIQVSIATTYAQLQQIAEGELARGQEIPIQVSIQTYSTGFEPGQQFTVSSTYPPVNDTFIVESVNSVEKGNTLMLSTIKASNAQFQRVNSPVQYMGQIIQATRPVLPTGQTTMTWALAATVSGVSNPGLATGLVAQTKAVQNDVVAGYITLHFGSVDNGTPTTSNIVFDVLRNGVSILTSQLTYVPGQALQKFWLCWLTDNLMLNQGDIISITITAADSSAKDGELDFVLV